MEVRPTNPYSSIFMQFLAKILQGFCSKPVCWGPLWEIMDPPLKTSVCASVNAAQWSLNYQAMNTLQK